MTDLRPQLTRTENFVTFGHVFFRYASGQTDKFAVMYGHVDRDTLRPTGGRSNYYTTQLCHSRTTAHDQCPPRPADVLTPNRTRDCTKLYEQRRTH